MRWHWPVLGLFAVTAVAQEPPAPTQIVVAPDRFAAALAPLVAARNAELVTLEPLFASTDGADDPERLKRRLYVAWRAGAQHVLLVGDADVLPFRFMVLDRVTAAAFDHAFYPSDLYYADVAQADGSFEDWNGARDGHHATYFGEVRGEKHKDGPINFDRIDYLPELAVGRWPVATAAEVTALVHKALAYERRIAQGGAPVRRLALVHVDGWIDARARLDALAAAIGQGWHVTKLYDRAEPADAPREARVVELLQAGALLVAHAGHGHPHGWERSLTQRALPQLAALPLPPILVSAGCSTAVVATCPPYDGYVDVHGRPHAGTNAGETFAAPPPPPSPYQVGPHNPTSFGEASVREPTGGAIAYIGCDTGAQPCALTLVEAFVTAATSGAPTIGDAWRQAIRDYHARERLAELVPTESWYPPSVYFQAMKFVLLGDPALPLPRGE